MTSAPDVTAVPPGPIAGTAARLAAGSAVPALGVPPPPPSAWPLFAGLGPLGALPTVPRLARAFCTLVLAGWGLGHLADDCELVASELCANVIRAATDERGNSRYDSRGRLPLLWLRLMAGQQGALRHLQIEVWDSLPPELGVPELRHAADTDETGRGLDIVAGLSRDWGWDHLPAHDAKRVWALLAA